MKPQSKLIGSRIQEPMETMALDSNLSNPMELTRDGAYEPIADDGARAAIVKITCGMSLQLVNCSLVSVVTLMHIEIWHIPLISALAS